MNNPRSGRRVLNFAVSGVLLGGGLVGGCAAKDKPVTNTGQVHEPGGDAKHMNMAHEAEPESVNVGPEGEPVDVKQVNTAHEDEPEHEHDAKHVNVAKEGDPEPPAKVNPGPTPSE